jgi:hypothetical protein
MMPAPFHPFERNSNKMKSFFWRLFLLSIAISAVAHADKKAKPAIGEVYVFDKTNHWTQFTSEASDRLYLKCVGENGKVFPCMIQKVENVTSDIGGEFGTKTLEITLAATTKK